MLGSFATGFLLYGVSWIYGITGITNLELVRHAIETPGFDSFALAGVAAALIFVGLGFKISAAPFQVWAPDVYQGAPAPVSAFLSVGPKAAAFAILLRIFLTAFGPIADRWTPSSGSCALATMIVGNFAALKQTNIKRMLAYSSIAHAGYMLVAVTAHSDTGAAAAMFYLAAYALTNIGAFAVVTYFARKGEQYVSIDDFAGLSQRQPMMAAMMTIFLLSLIGVPLTGGFFGKFYIFKSALDANLVWLTDPGPAEQRRSGILLPAHPGRHVHEGARRVLRKPPARRLRPEGSRLRLRARHTDPRHLPRPDPRLRQPHSVEIASVHLLSPVLVARASA